MGEVKLVPFTKTAETEDGLIAKLSLCAWLLKRVRPQSQWTSRVKTLLAEYPEVPLAAMGFPAAWQTLALWK